MAPMDDWKRDIFEGTRRENWSLRGPASIVKVMPLGATPANSIDGYITVGKYLVGKTPLQIERVLGLKDKDLENGARIFRFTRLPMAHEYEYELTTLYPGGLAFNPAHSDLRYPPGSAKIHQWRILPDAAIPIDTINFLDLLPNETFPYEWLI